MATIAVPRPIPSHQPSPAIDAPITPPLSLEAIAAPVPNKHIPVCPTGPAKAVDPETPPPSPKSAQEAQQDSTLYPPDAFVRLGSDGLSVYEIDAAHVAHALDFASRQPLPQPTLVFPWLHGLHPHNHLQQAFFTARRRVHRKTPCCLRAVTVVKADGDLTVARLKGAIAPEEFMLPGPNPEFVDADPRDGFSVRNFHIQPAKVALTSDIIVYDQDLDEARRLAWDIAAAQQQWREKHIAQGEHLPQYSTFICTSPFSEFEENHGEIVSVDSDGHVTGRVVDFVHQERREMWDMTEASEISHNVFLGPSPELGSPEEQQFDVLIECSDTGRMNPPALQQVARNAGDKVEHPFHEFPSSGSILPPTWSQTEADGILETCHWIYHISHGTYPTPDPHDVDAEADFDGDSPMLFGEDTHHERGHPRRVLIHCADGYTESSMLAIAYFSFSTGRPVPDAWLNLHTAKHRNFFAYPTDVALLTAIAPRLLRESPVCVDRSLEDITKLVKDEPKWFTGLDGSFPSRVLDYLYLGNLGHANNPDLLKELGIHQLLSVGETAMWRDGDMEKWGEGNVCVVQGVQDNGIDALNDEFTRCLEFIGKSWNLVAPFLALLPHDSLTRNVVLTRWRPDRGRRNGTATLVHCRVGVSRSATICIAETMRALNMSFPRAYCFVRARRLNVIIQPHLRFAYELLMWEEILQQDGDASRPIKRELEWGEITREIALMNRPYAR